jgi:hypothetical protein
LFLCAGAGFGKTINIPFCYRFITNTSQERIEVYLPKAEEVWLAVCI